MSYAEKTTVSPARTREAIEKTLSRFGAHAFGYLNEPGRAVVMFEIRQIRIVYRLPLPDPGEERFTTTPAGQSRSPAAANEQHQQAIRQRWRALLASITAKLAAIEAGISTVEEEFLPHIAVPQGGTFGDYAYPALDKAYAEGMLPEILPPARPELLPGADR
jgi:hypothetical protein